MRILVTGGTGVVGDAAVRALLAHGHRVRLLARHATDDARVWPERLPNGAGVEPHDGDVTDPPSLAGAARGCDVVLHLAGIVDEDPPERTFTHVNVDGTRAVVDEAARAGVQRFVYASSLGAERGASPYHQSKHAGELEAQRFPGAWTVLRLGNVYGPGDEVVSLLLRMVRALPALPMIGGGDIPFQPIWAGDCGEALARACERDDLGGATFELAGPERTSMRDLLDRFARLTGKEPLRVPMPLPLASVGIKLADAVGVDLGINSSQLTMLAEGNVIEDAGANALVTVLGVAPTPLDEGLRELLDHLPEQLPDSGLGGLHHKRYFADVTGPRVAADVLFRQFCTRFQQFTPSTMDLEAEPATPRALPALHETVTMALPLRGTVQVRVAELTGTAITLQTVDGHPLAGAVRFAFDEQHPEGESDATPSAGTTGGGARPFRFTVEVFERSADPFDWIAMALGGSQLQRANWRSIVDTVVTESGGAGTIEEAHETLDADAAGRVEEWLRGLATERARAENAEALGAADR